MANEDEILLEVANNRSGGMMGELQARIRELQDDLRVVAEERINEKWTWHHEKAHLRAKVDRLKAKNTVLEEE